ncbi:hypothetical protein HY637_03095 [Candidatus Woesearchaeota archaeon]|nr:hypothetical protein [Candidatus Woesearchaeota archaeon]
MFFRIKRVKGKEYAYIVENEWKRKGSRQKVKKYVGRAYRFELKNDADFNEFNKIKNAESYLSENSFSKILNDLIEWEVFRHGIDMGKFIIELNEPKVQQKRRNAVLMINDGFMCGITLKNVMGFKLEDGSTDGYRFARAFVEAGIKIPQEIFVGVFGKLYKTEAGIK